MIVSVLPLFVALCTWKTDERFHSTSQDKQKSIIGKHHWVLNFKFQERSTKSSQLCSVCSQSDAVFFTRCSFRHHMVSILIWQESFSGASARALSAVSHFSFQVYSLDI